MATQEYSVLLVFMFNGILDCSDFGRHMIARQIIFLDVRHNQKVDSTTGETTNILHVFPSKV